MPPAGRKKYGSRFYYLVEEIHYCITYFVVVTNNFQYLFRRNIHNTMLNKVSQNSRHYHTRRNTVYIENLSPEMQERALWSDDKSIDDDIYFHCKADVEFEIYNNDFEIYQE